MIAKNLRLAPIAMVALPVATLMLAGTLAAQTAASSPQAAIAVRQANYKKMGAAMKTLNDQLKGNAPAKTVILGAAQALAMAAREQPRQFPVGSGPAAGVTTDALPNIWTDRKTFDGQMARMIAESAKLVTVINGGNMDSIRVQAKATGATCAACHRQFRADT
jgi:cytochrome c556